MSVNPNKENKMKERMKTDAQEEINILKEQISQLQTCTSETGNMLMNLDRRITKVEGEKQ